MEKVYDIIILGGGPAGLAAGLYAGRAKADTLIIEKGNIGGLITSTHEIENYPGGLKGDSGSALTERMREQAESFGAKIILDDIISAEITSEVKVLKSYNATYKAKSIIIASGALPRFLGVTGEAEHIGMGVSYCATCDGPFFNGLELFVVGGGDSALEEGMYLTRFARKVHIVHRRDEFRAAKSIVEKAEKNSKIFFILDSVIDVIKGDGVVDEIRIRNIKTQEMTVFKADPSEGMMGVFVYAGSIPNTAMWQDIIKLDDIGYIMTDTEMRTDSPGIFAAGDVRHKGLRQVATAVADGSISAVYASNYIDSLI
jgi:thioredoxin reductase (NADPH)